MAQQIINIGSGPLAGDGESIRSAFAKTNENFTELYSGQIGPTGPSGPLGPTGPAGPGADQDLNTTSSVVFDNLTITNNSYFSNDVSVLNSNLKIIADNNTGLILSANSSTDILNHGLLRFSKQYGDTGSSLSASQKIGSVEFDGYQVGNGFAADYETNKFFPGILVTPFSFNPNSASTKIQFLNRAPFLSGSSDPFNNLGNTTDTNVIASLTVDPLNITAQSQKFTLSNPHQGYSSLVNPTSALTDGLYGIQRLGNPLGGETFDLELSSGHADQGLYNSYLYISSRSDNIPYWLPFYGGMTTATNKQIEFENIVDPGNSLTSTIYSGSVVKGANIKLNTLRYEKIEKSVFKNGVERSGDVFWNTSTKAGDVLGTISFQGGLEGSSDSTSINGNVDGVIIRAYAKNDWAGQQTSTTTNVTFNDNLSALRIEVATTTTVGGLNSSASGLQQRYKNVFEIDATTATFNTDVWINGNILQNGSPLSGGSSVTASETAPVSPSVGNLWYDTASGRLYVYYDSYWTDASPALSGSSVAKVSSTAPSTPVLGDLWYDTASGRLYVYYDSYWADATPVTMGPTGPTGPQGDVGPTGPVVDLTTVSSHIIPSADLTYDLGSTSSQWRSLYVGTGTIYIGGIPLSVTTSGTLIVDGNPVNSGFDQDLNTDDSPNFVNLGLAGTEGAGYATLSIATDRDFYIGLTDTSTGAKTFEFGRDGSLSVPGETTFNANIYGGTNNRLWLGGSAEEGTPSISLPNNADGASQPITINNGQGGGVQITTGAGNWLFDNDGLLNFPATGVNEYNIGESVDGFNVRSNLTFGIVTNSTSTSSTWVFGTDGSLTLPGGGLLGQVWDDGIDTELTLKSPPGVGDSGYVALSSANERNYVEVSNIGVVLAVEFNTEGSKTLTFGTDGSLTFPNGAVIKDNADSSVSFGGGAGATNQGAGAVAIGEGAGNNTQSNQAVAIGRGSGNYQQGVGAVGVGFCAGATEQGDYAVAIGFKAARGNMDNDGTPNQPANSIMINASSTPLNGNQAGLYINPVREDNTNTAKVVYYNTTTKELTYTDATGGSGNSLSSDNENITVTIANAVTPGNTSTWTFATDEFVYLPSGGVIGDVFGGGMTGIQADPDNPGAYASLVSGDKQQAVDATNDEVIIWTDDDAQGGTLTKQWTFKRNGEMVFPNQTIQTTAYTGDYNDLTNKPTIPFSVVSVPTESTSTGVAGDIAYNENYFYVCTATNAWQRIGWDVTPW